MVSTQMEIEKKLKMMSDFGLKASNKSLEFKGSQGQIQMIIGKKESKHYKLIIGGGISPIQATAVAVSQI